MVKRNREKREPEKLDSNRQSKTESQEGESRMAMIQGVEKSKETRFLVSLECIAAL